MGVVLDCLFFFCISDFGVSRVHYDEALEMKVLLELENCHRRWLQPL